MKTLLSLFLLIFSLVPTAQNAVNDIPWSEKGIWLESPRARAFREVAMPSPGLLTGACEFYDDYAFIDNLCLGDGVRFAAPSGGSAAPKARPAGLLTGLYAGKGHEAYYYDDDGREMQRVATGHNLGRRTTSYTWDGKPAEMRHDYSATAMPLPQRHVLVNHDDAGRPMYTTVWEGDRSEANVDHVYDALGDVIAVDFRGGTVSYTRDLHGWLTSVTYSRAGGSVIERLRYADAPAGATPCFNGNVSSRITDQGRYDYSYDSSNRLVRAAFTPPDADTAGTDFSAEYSYDARGNITDIRRRGVTERLPDGTETFGYVENRSVSHDGNRIRSVNNYAVVSPGLYTGARALPVAGMRMAYDFAGRLVSDATRGITRISYDNDGHPTSVSFGDGARHAMAYDGLGRLMSVTYYVDETVAAPSGAVAGIVRTTCLGARRYTGDGHVLLSGAMVARDSILSFSRAAPMTGLWLEESRFGDGFFDAGGNDMYYVRDRLGNVTAVADGDGNVRQRTGCYPYGMPWRPLGTESSNRVLFGGKEYHTADGLDEYDFGARRHYPRFPAFTTPDPHADNTPWLSPYVFCAANPVAYVDPSGKDAIVTIQGNTITISANIFLEGNLATEELAAEYQKKIMDVWGAVFKIKYGDIQFDVNWDINVCVAPKGKERNYDGKNNYLEVQNIDDKGMPQVSKISNTNTGIIRSIGFYGRELADDNPMAHEFGHMLGLKDRYVNKTVPPEWKGNVMSEPATENVKVDSRNMTGVLGNALNGYPHKLVDFHSNPSNKGKTLRKIWYINQFNRE